MKYRVKISQPANWANKINLSTPGETGIWGDFQFILTNEPIECDYWIVMGDISANKEQATCYPENVFYLTDEAHTEKKYDENFLKQFPLVITSRKDIIHPSIIEAPYICGWFLQKNHDFLFNLAFDKSVKSKIISTVTSDKTALPGHKMRFAFINQMIGHFKDRLDLYGDGFNPVDDKFDALFNYKYSISIENSSLNGYFTEKITDCFLTYTMPVYYGCNNIFDYFPKESIIMIDIKNYKVSIDIIEEAIRSDLFSKNMEAIIEARNIYFKKYHPIAALANVLQMHVNKGSRRKAINLTNFEYFNKTKGSIIKRLF